MPKCALTEYLYTRTGVLFSPFLRKSILCEFDVIVNCLNFFTLFPVTQVVDVFNVSLFPYIFLILVSTFNLSSSWIPQNSLCNRTARDSFHGCNHPDHNHCICSKAWANLSEGGYLQLWALRTALFICVLNTQGCVWWKTAPVTLQCL